MTILERLFSWKEAGAITATQHDEISAIVRKQLFSVFFELNALLYFGVLSLIAGAAAVIQVYASNLGDAAILSGLTFILLASFYYCFSRGLPYSSLQIESPTLVFDYVLYLACLTFGLEIGYLESRFHVVQGAWDSYLLISAGLFFGLAYRFDNRLVLSLALATLASFFGIWASRFPRLFGESVRGPAFIYATAVMAVGAWLFAKGIKRHFTEIYFHVGVLALLAAVLSEVIAREGWFDLAVVLVFAASAIFGGIHFRKFAFVFYGVIAGYIAISSQLLRDSPIDSTFALTYFLISGSVVTISMLLLARRSGRQQ